MYVRAYLLVVYNKFNKKNHMSVIVRTSFVQKKFKNTRKSFFFRECTLWKVKAGIITKKNFSDILQIFRKKKYAVRSSSEQYVRNK